MINLSYLFLFVFIFSITSYIFIFLYRIKIANFLKTNDFPDNKRKIHTKPTPQVAAYSLALTLVLVLILNVIYSVLPHDFNNIIISSLAVFVIGFLDDRIDLSPYIKLFAVSIVIFLSINFSDNLIIYKFYTKTYDTFILLDKFAVSFTLLCVLLLVNSLNMADGINGLAIGLVFFWLFYIIQIYETNINIIIIIILTNLLISFFYTFKGKHFLGDSGSLMLSTFVSLISVYGSNIYSKQSLFPNSAEQLVILFLIPGLDMFRLFCMRIAKRKNPLRPDRNHLHHYLIKKNSLAKTLFLYFLIVNIPIIATFYLKFELIYVLIASVIAYFFIIFITQKDMV